MSSSDSTSRNLIETDTSTNFFVEAGAGSGKTTELVARMIAMVEAGVDVSQICAITFTKAAANEFYDRFQRALMKSKSEYAKSALQNIDLCFMGTIDSFANMIISEHPADAKVPADSKVVDTNQMHELWKAQLAEIANGAYGKELQEKYKKFVKVCRNSEDIFISGLDFLLNTKNVDFKYVASADGNFEDIFKDEINDITDALNFLVGDGIKVSESSEGDSRAIYFAKLALKLINNFEENFDSIIRALNKLSGASGIRFDKSVDLDNYPGIPKYAREMFYQSETKTGKPSFWLIETAKDGGNPFHKKDFDNYIFNTSVDFIYSAAKSISDVLKRQGYLSYSDYLFYLKEMLKEDAASGAKLINHIYSRHKYYLIDEFQDTDPLQAEIFFYLTSSNLEEIKTWKDCIPHPGSLFIVGDPKQSIYRFRNADVASYLNVKKMFENEKVGKVLTLSKNFRSNKPMCDWFNKAFNEILQDKPGIQSGYVDIPLDEKAEYAASFGGAQKQIYVGNSLKNSPATQNLVSIITELVDNEKYTIEDPPRKIEYKDIMVITYKKDHLKFYMDALRKNNIPYFVEGNVLFDDCPALTAVSAMYNLVVNPKDIKAQKASSLLIPDGMSDGLAAEYKSDVHNLTPVALFSKLIDEQKIIAQCGTKNIEYMYYALELLRKRETSAEVTTHFEAAEFIAQLVAGKTDEERCLQFAVDDNRVHLANLHKVKGLQAPIVIMAEAKMKNHDPTKHVDYMCESPSSCIFELSGEGFGYKISNWNNEEEKNLETEILKAEKDRLLYVAATRAKSAFIATDFTNKDGGVPATNQAVNLLAQIDRKIDIGDSIDESGKIIVENLRVAKSKDPITDRFTAEKLYDKSIEECVVNKNSEEASFDIELPSKAVLKIIPLTDTKQTNSRRDAAFVGVIVHRLLELCVLARQSDVDCNVFVKQVINEFDIQDQSYIDALNAAVENAKSVLDKLKGAESIFCEMPFCYKKDENTICNGVIDLVYKDSKGWHIIDYKTNFDDSYLDIKYENQLNDYKAALKEIVGVDASAEILHIAV